MLIPSRLSAEDTRKSNAFSILSIVLLALDLRSFRRVSGIDLPDSSSLASFLLSINLPFASKLSYVLAPSDSMVE